MDKSARDIIILRLENWGRWARPHRALQTSPLYSLMKQYGEADPEASYNPEIRAEAINAADAIKTDNQLVRLCNDTELAVVKLAYIKRLSNHIIAARLLIYKSQIPAILESIYQKLDREENINIINGG